MISDCLKPQRNPPIPGEIQLSATFLQLRPRDVGEALASLYFLLGGSKPFAGADVGGVKRNHDSVVVAESAFPSVVRRPIAVRRLLAGRAAVDDL